MDRLPWSRWHWLVVFALGITWLLDGLEVTIVGAIATVLENKHTLSMSSSQVGVAGGIYVAGNVVGALVFGYLTDRLGRKRLFTMTLGLYLVATVATAFSWSAMAFFVFRFLTGAGIGGEYSAVNSATEELNPARVRGTVELAINGSWWLGTAIGALASVVVLNPRIFAVDVGWRVTFALGAILGVAVLLVRRLLPESPRWLMTHGRLDEAEEVVADVESQVAHFEGERPDQLPPVGDARITVQPREGTPMAEVIDVVFRRNGRRTLLGLALMVGQTFLYNAVFFTFALTLSTFFKVADTDVGWYLLIFAVGNFLGPLVLGRLFDVVGRRPMIAGTYLAAAVGTVVVGLLFAGHAFGPVGLTAALGAVFFFASAGASAGYLTVSEVFPLEVRANAIAFFYAVGSGLGGIAGPILFGALVQSGDRHEVLVGYVIGGVLMAMGAVVELFLGVAAEQRSLEDVAEPLSAQT
jgi:MFS family permease